MTSAALDNNQPRRRGRPRKSEAPALTLEQLLHASADIFARDGYDGVSLRKLQAELGVSYTFFHHYFDSKEALWKAVIDRLAGETSGKVLQALSQIDDSHDELDALREAIAIYIRSAFEYPAIYHISQQESLRPGPRLDYLYQRYFGPAWQLIEDMVARAKQQHALKDIPNETLYFMVQSATAAVVQQPLYAKMTGREELTPRQIDTHIQQCIDLLFSGWCL